MERGTVLYVAAEGAEGLAARRRAWEAHNNVRGLDRLRWYPEPVNLFDRREAAAFAALTAEIAPAFVVIDTLARSMVGAEENSARDMGVVIEAAEAARRASGANVTCVHHTPKAGTAKARGSGSLEGAVTTEVEVSADGETVNVKNSKQKNGPRFESLTLRLVPLEESAVLASGRRGSTEDDRDCCTFG